MKTTMTDRPFGRVLAEMRHAGQNRQHGDLQRRAQASLARAQQIMSALSRVEQAVQLIEGLLAELGREICPDIHVGHRFFDGRWLLTARLDELWMEPDGCPRRATSQVAILLDSVIATGHLGVECHVSVRGRDLPVNRFDASAAADEGGLAGFVEETLLQFAAGWLDVAGPGQGRPSLAA